MKHIVWVSVVALLQRVNIGDASCISDNKYNLDVFDAIAANPSLINTSLTSLQLPASSRLNSSAPVYMFTGYGLHIGNTTISNQIRNASCSNNELMLYADLYITDDSSGPIIVVSYSLSQMPSLFGLYGDSRSGNITVTYLSNGRLHLEVFRMALTTNTWYKVAAVLSGNSLSIYLGCKPFASRQVPLPDYCLKTSVTVSVGASAAVDQPFDTGLYAFMQHVGLAFGDNSLAFQCPDLPYSCATCGQYARLLYRLYELQNALELAEIKLNSLLNGNNKDTPTAVSCQYGNTSYPDAAFINVGSTVYYCRMGSWAIYNCSNCSALTAVITPPTSVTVTTTAPSNQMSCSYSPTTTIPVGDFIAVYAPATQSCLFKYCLRHGTALGISQTPYSCTDNYMLYSTCAPTFNATLMIVSLCCLNINCTMCNFVTCPSNSLCSSNRTSYTCTCNTGFDPWTFANGTLAACNDHNECAYPGGLANGGNDCPVDSTCVNTVGSFTCNCKTGIRLQVSRGGSKTCQDINECLEGASCPNNSVCVNTYGSYLCQCNDGYSKNSNGTCEPVCVPRCENNMKCVSPNVCNCENRFTGAGCEVDVNECAGNHSCSALTTLCINTVGSYFCQCRRGFMMVDANNCADINECEGAVNPCSIKGALCVNSIGSYACKCGNNGAACAGMCPSPNSGSSMLKNGQSTVFNCSNYTCVSGKLVSMKLSCDCTSQLVNKSCCPECQQQKCRVNLISGQTVTMLPGTTWIDPTDSCYQCSCSRQGLNSMCQNMRNNCPSVSSCPRGRVYTLPNQCCPLCELPVCNPQNERIVVPLMSGCETCVCRNATWQCSTPSVSQCLSAGSNCTAQSAIFSGHCCHLCPESVLGSACNRQ